MEGQNKGTIANGEWIVGRDLQDRLLHEGGLRRRIHDIYVLASTPTANFECYMQRTGGRKPQNMAARQPSCGELKLHLRGQTPLVRRQQRGCCDPVRYTPFLRNEPIYLRKTFSRDAGDAYMSLDYWPTRGCPRRSGSLETLEFLEGFVGRSFSLSAIS